MGVLSKWKLLIVIKHIEPRLNNLNVVEKFIEVKIWLLIYLFEERR